MHRRRSPVRFLIQPPLCFGTALLIGMHFLGGCQSTTPTYPSASARMEGPDQLAPSPWNMVGIVHKFRNESGHIVIRLDNPDLRLTPGSSIFILNKQLQPVGTATVTDMQMGAFVGAYLDEGSSPAGAYVGYRR